MYKGKAYKLSSKKFDFAVADELNKAISEAEEAIKQLEKIESEAKSLIKDARQLDKEMNRVSTLESKVSSQALKTQTKVADALDKIEKSAKELGISPSSVPSYKQGDKIYNSIETATNKSGNAMLDFPDFKF